jgi:STE24 endopeptidase
MSAPLERRLAWLITIGAGAAFVVLAALLVPWQPVPGGMPAPVSASDVFTAAEIARGEEFARTTRLLSWAALAVSVAVACVLGLTPRGTRLLGRRRLPWPVTVVGLVAVVLLIGRLAVLPFGWFLHRRYVDNGLSTQDTTAWLVDEAKGYAIAVVATSVALLVLVGCARRWRRWWPAVAALLSAGLVVLGSFVYPLVVEPVFNNFTSMPDGPLRSQILRLADQEGVRVDDVLVADASRRTTTLNAYVSGFGGTRRVVVYDNLVDTLPRDQVLSVVAHELGHAKHDDVLVGTALGALGAMAGVGLLALLVGTPGLQRRAGVRGMADPRSVALVLALFALGSLVSAPVQNTISRQIETRADVDALKATDDSVAFVKMQRTLALRSLADPTPPRISQFWFGSHPTVLQRVAVADRFTRR